MGLSYCNGTSNEWVTCDQADHPRALTSPDPCSCPTATAERSVHLSQSSIIPAVGILPINLGASISFYLGHYPTPHTSTATSMGTATYTSSILFSTSIFTPTPTLIAPSQSQTDQFNPATSIITAPVSEQGFNKSAKIGAAVGAAAIGLLVLIALGDFLLRRHRKKRARQHKQQQQEENSIDTLMNGSKDKSPASNLAPHNIGLAIGGPDDVPQPAGPHTPAMSELDSTVSRPWSELESSPTVGGLSTRSERTASQSGHGLGHGRAGPSELASQPLVELPG